MPFAWTGRQFVGGALCLDLANTVYYADDPAHRGDRLRDADDIAGWLAAACRFGPVGDYRPMLAAPDDAFDTGALADMLLLRQAVDDLFRSVAAGLAPPSLSLRPVLHALGGAMAEVGIAVGPDGLSPALGPSAGASAATARAAIAHSALALAMSPALHRLKRCPNCHWLFVDRSRNSSRLWCDMLTCGNRAKAQRHYEARRAASQ